MSENEPTQFESDGDMDSEELMAMAEEEASESPVTENDDGTDDEDKDDKPVKLGASERVVLGINETTNLLEFDRFLFKDANASTDHLPPARVEAIRQFPEDRLPFTAHLRLKDREVEGGDDDEDDSGDVDDDGADPSADNSDGGDKSSKVEEVEEEDNTWHVVDLQGHRAPKRSVRAGYLNTATKETMAVDKDGFTVPAKLPESPARRVGSLSSTILPLGKSALKKASQEQIAQAIATIGGTVTCGDPRLIGGVVCVPGVAPVEPSAPDYPLRCDKSPYASFGEQERSEAATVTITWPDDGYTCRFARRTLVQMTLAEYIEMTTQAHTEIQNQLKLLESQAKKKLPQIMCAKQRIVDIEKLLQAAKSYTTDKPMSDDLGAAGGVDPNNVVLTFNKYCLFAKKAVLAFYDTVCDVWAPNHTTEKEKRVCPKKDMALLVSLKNTILYDIHAHLKMPGHPRFPDLNLRKVVRVPILPYDVWVAVKNANKKLWLACKKQIAAQKADGEEAPEAPKKKKTPAAAATETAKKQKPTTPKKKKAAPAAAAEAAAKEVVPESAPSKSDIAEKTTSSNTEKVVQASSARDVLDSLSAQVVAVEEDKDEPVAKKPEAAAKKSQAAAASPKKASVKKAPVKKAPVKKRKRDEETTEKSEPAVGEAEEELLNGVAWLPGDALIKEIGQRVVDRVTQSLDKAPSAEAQAVSQQLFAIDAKLDKLPADHKSVVGPWTNVEAGALTAAQKQEIASAARTLRFIDSSIFLKDHAAIVQRVTEYRAEQEAAAEQAAKKTKKVEFADEAVDDQAAADLDLFD